jgi:hypothetical protein
VSLILPEDEFNKSKRMVIIDWLYDPAPNKKVAQSLLSAVIQHAVIQRVDSISAISSAGSILRLPFSFPIFFRRLVNRPVIFYGDDNGINLLGDHSPWHFTWSDTDSF